MQDDQTDEAQGCQFPQGEVLLCEAFGSKNANRKTKRCKRKVEREEKTR
jgi:hypothetical protein